jgi:hypothetical protein
VRIFKKPKSRFYWFDFTVRGQRYRESTSETKAVRATKVASMKLAQAVEHGNLFATRATVLSEFSERFLTWLEHVRVEEKNEKILPKRLSSAESDTSVQSATDRNHNGTR